MNTIQSCSQPIRDINKFLDLRMAAAVQQSVEAAKEMAEIEFDLAKFELFYAATTPKNRIKAVERILTTDRKARWRDALREAGGDELKALKLYDSMQ